MLSPENIGTWFYCDLLRCVYTIYCKKIEVMYLFSAFASCLLGLSYDNTYAKGGGY